MPPAPSSIPGQDAVVFASYVPTEEALGVAREFLKIFTERFADCDFFVGINPGSLPEWDRSLRGSGLRTLRIGMVDPSLAVDSDASGFQRALQLMREEGKEYRLTWFGHTKGATANRPDVRRHFIEDFFMERNRITDLFENPSVGAFGYDISLYTDWAKRDERMNLLFPFPFAGIGTFYLHTFYVLRGSIVKKFIEGCSKDFFTKNLVGELGFDRYFFEQDFSRTADRFGFYPVYRRRHQHRSQVPVTRRTVRALYRQWERQLPKSMRTKIGVAEWPAEPVLLVWAKSVARRTPLRDIVRWRRRTRMSHPKGHQ